MYSLRLFWLLTSFAGAVLSVVEASASALADGNEVNRVQADLNGRSGFRYSDIHSSTLCPELTTEDDENLKILPGAWAAACSILSLLMLTGSAERAPAISSKKRDCLLDAPKQSPPHTIWNTETAECR